VSVGAAGAAATVLALHALRRRRPEAAERFLLWKLLAGMALAIGSLWLLRNAAVVGGLFGAGCTAALDSILEFARGEPDKWRQRRNNRTLNATRAGRHNPHLAEVLSHFYPGFERPWADTSYPVAVFRAPPRQVAALESILGSLQTQALKSNPTLAKAGEEYVGFLRTLGGPLRDDPTYVLKSIKVAENVTLDCAMGTYFDALRSCDVLEWELLTVLGKAKEHSGLDSLLRKLKLRNYVHSLTNQPVTEPTGRSAAIAISTVVLFRRENEYAVLLQRRAKEGGVAVHRELWHVVPSFMFQPVVGATIQEYSVTHNIYREYLEELFDVPEVRRSPSVIAYDYFYNNPNLGFLRGLLKAGDAQLLLSGVAISLLNLRPEICALLHIDSPEWYDAHKAGGQGLSRIALNEEWQSANLSVQPLTSIKRGFPSPDEMVPTGAAALFLAVQTAAELGLGKRI